ncbi:MAG: ABC-type Fe3+/spermidine/putrescine transport system ATPase subunit [Desulforhopalus sp.]
MGSLELQNVTIGYDDQAVISNLSLSVREGELLSLLGPSGVGKTTLLKTIAGLTTPITGVITIDGKNVAKVPADRRDTVLLFQKPLLFPFLTVSENIGFGLKMKKWKQKLITAKSEEVMELTEISNLGPQKPHQLSGGQQQRVALARALVLEPSILLLDEPFSNLDADLRQKMQSLIQRLQKETATTMLFVTHDQSEAFIISDRIALLIDGQIRQVDTPEKLYTSPATSEVAHFFGNPNIISGAIDDGLLQTGKLKLPVNFQDNTLVQIVIRPEDIIVSTSQKPNSIYGTVINRQFEGALTRLTIQLEHLTLTALSFSSNFTVGQHVWVTLPPDKIHIL